MATKILLLLMSVLLLSACATKSRYFSWPNTTFVIASQFKHIALVQSNPGDNKRLHVYIEGDGIPFRNRFLVSKDPSPQGSLMLRLMEQDTRESLYLGRPCYFNYALPAMLDKQCNAQYWTTARYSEQVVANMIHALRQHLATRPASGVTLIGHSGGGTIAMLMAARMPEVDQLVTLAANLDTQAWTQLHHYTSLRDSLNPTDLLKTAQPSRQMHFAGDKDNNTPPALSETLLNRIGQPIHILANADHNCCWQSQWRELLVQINQQMDF